MELTAANRKLKNFKYNSWLSSDKSVLFIKLKAPKYQSYIFFVKKYRNKLMADYKYINSKDKYKDSVRALATGALGIVSRQTKIKLSVASKPREKKIILRKAKQNINA